MAMFIPLQKLVEIWHQNLDKILNYIIIQFVMIPEHQISNNITVLTVFFINLMQVKYLYCKCL